MSDIADFLLARFADDEASARYVLAGPSGPYDAEWVEPWSGSVDPGNGGLFSTNDSTLSRFIIEHDPARVLAECEAKRKIVRSWDLDLSENGAPLGGEAAELQYGHLRDLASIYADHPDCRPEWKP